MRGSPAQWGAEPPPRYRAAAQVRTVPPVVNQAAPNTADTATAGYSSLKWLALPEQVENTLLIGSAGETG